MRPSWVPQDKQHKTPQQNIDANDIEAAYKDRVQLRSADGREKEEGELGVGEKRGWDEQGCWKEDARDRVAGGIGARNDVVGEMVVEFGEVIPTVDILWRSHLLVRQALGCLSFCGEGRKVVLDQQMHLGKCVVMS